MKRSVITISDEGMVIVPTKVRMTAGEIANLFGVYYQTAARHVREIEKSGIASDDHSMGCTCNGLKINPDYYGLEMIVALAFRINTWQADRLRRWVMERLFTGTDKFYMPMFLDCGTTGIVN